jgi:transposase
MFVRKKKNSSGKICVQVIDKVLGKYKVLHTVGSSSDDTIIDQFEKRASQWIAEKKRTLEFDFTNEKAQFTRFADSIIQFELAGVRLLLDHLFDNIGFNAIDDEVFRYLVYYRLVYPRSKLKTTEFLARYHGIFWSEDHVYRYLDKLYNRQKEQVQAISFEHTIKALGGELRLVFYDVTTIYFEIDLDDDLRKTGYSKDGKSQQPQIVLGLLVSEHGYPLTYDIFEGNKFEGHTMLPILRAFKAKYALEKLVIVADAGLLSATNINELRNEHFEFILGARLKREKKEIQNQILSLKLNHGESRVLSKDDLKLVVNYSEDRAKKDAYNRNKGLKKLERMIESEKLTKANINNKGYNKFLVMEGDIRVKLDEQKVAEDQKWDGLKGYLTNSDLTKEQIIANYAQLWNIEKAFRIAKSELKIRPVFHRLQRRIEAHICITFAAYKIYKELEKELKERGATISAGKAIEIALSIFELKFELPHSKEHIKKLIIVNDEQKYLANLFGF